MKGKKLENIFWGLFFIAAAVILVLNKMGMLEGVGTISIWKLFLAAVLAVCGVRSICHKNATGFIFAVAFICILYAEQMGIAALSPWTILLAAVLLSIGFSMLFHKKKSYQPYNSSASRGSTDTETDDYVKTGNSFSSSVKCINSQNLKKAQIDCSFGEMKVYFDNAAIQGDEAILDMNVKFSGVELYVPRTWRVECQPDALIFGGIEEKNVTSCTGVPVLKLVGKISFSGITIIYV